VNALGREALIHDGERWVKVSLDRDVDRHHRYILEGAARERSWRPAPPAPPEARRGLGDLLLHQFTETPRAEERVGVAHLMATYVREHPPMSAWIVDPSRDPDERVRVICIEACARNDLSPLPDLAGRACGASLPERIAYASGLVTRDAPVAVDAWDWLLSDPSDDVRATALLLLSTRRVPDLCRRAIPLLLDPSPDVWTRAASSLRVVFYNDLVRLAAAVRAVAEAAAWTTTETQLALVRVSSDAGVLASLRPLFAHDDASLRRAALETLSHRAAEPLDLAALRPILADRADAVRAAAWRYVAHAGLPVSSLAAETAAALADEGEVRAALPLALVRGTALDQPWQREALLRCVADPVARKALGALAEALSQLAFERVAADW